MADRQQHSDSIDIVKRVICVNKFKNLIFLSRIIFPNILNPIYRPVNSLLQYRSDMVIPARVSSIISSDFKYTFRKKTAPNFSDTHRTHYGERIQCNQATVHKYLTGRPWWLFLDRLSTKDLTLAQSFLLWSPSFTSHPCNASISIPLATALPESFRATDSTTSSVISMGIKTGVASYTSNTTPRFFSRAEYFLPIPLQQF